jgi:hypothetical protein
MPSAVWSSLVTLELVAPFVSLPPDQPKSYQRLANSRRDDITDRFLPQRQQELCTSIVLVGASSPDSHAVTACCAEVSSRLLNIKVGLGARARSDQILSSRL